MLKGTSKHGGSFHHYRASIIGQELEESLDEFIENGIFEEEQKKTIMELFRPCDSDSSFIMGAHEGYRERSAASLPKP